MSLIARVPRFGRRLLAASTVASLVLTIALGANPVVAQEPSASPIPETTAITSPYTWIAEWLAAHWQDPVPSEIFTISEP
jgi:hypothetical protein